MWVLGTEPGSSARAINHRGSPAPTLYIRGQGFVCSGLARLVSDLRRSSGQRLPHAEIPGVHHHVLLTYWSRAHHSLTSSSQVLGFLGLYAVVSVSGFRDEQWILVCVMSSSCLAPSHITFMFWVVKTRKLWSTNRSFLHLVQCGFMRQGQFLCLCFLKLLLCYVWVCLLYVHSSRGQKWP